MNFCSPIRQKKAPKETKEPKPKKQPKITPADVKRILDIKTTPTTQTIDWTQRWMETLVRGNSYPPQLLGKDCYSLLLTFLNPKDSLAILEQIRKAYVSYQPPQPLDEYSFLQGIAEIEEVSQHLPEP